jgi:hypothetical protein
MISIVTLAIGAFGFNPESAIPLDVLKSAGFEMSQSMPAPEQGRVIAIFRDESKATVQVHLHVFATERDRLVRMSGRPQDRDPIPAGLEGLYTAFPDGLPFGTDQRWRSTGGQFQAIGKSPFEFVIVSASGGGYLDPQGSMRRRPQGAEASDLTQRVARHLMARAASRRLEGGRTVSLAGKQVLVRRNSKKSFDHVALDSWASARGWALNVNPTRASAALTKGSRMIIVPLGSGYVKVDSEWRDAGDLVAEVSGKWFVPLPLLEAAQ